MADDIRFPIFFVTGVSYAASREEQKRWQSLSDRAEAKYLASMRARRACEPARATPPIVREFINANLFRTYGAV